MTEAGLTPRSNGGRWVAVGALLAALLLLGVYDVAVLNFLTKWWQRALAAVGLRQQLEALQQGISGSVVKRPLPAVMTYAVGYLSVCLLLLRLLLPAPAQWRLVLRLYAGTLAVYVALVVLGKLAGDAQWAYRLGRQLLDFVVSPLPVAGLYVLLRSGFGARAKA
ncbi:hypothetical protein MUN81_20655 [Hymenobacter sp. 5317J-9]|uniref:XrtX-associated membrane protein n=1 Tax=Hymenobacter sp. 5317J-9 TaxID=2932250 RepID=UPI001FD70E63|nr:hypothetical protein [Hymenobacter sp. 5317J-9]UOQ97628.1 hypothetical protein MUN81_20655 [Hymenobacter sp. 5317J-9]